MTKRQKEHYAKCRGKHDDQYVWLKEWFCVEQRVNWTLMKSDAVRDVPDEVVEWVLRKGKYHFLYYKDAPLGSIPKPYGIKRIGPQWFAKSKTADA